jgi:hypothetical protein
MGMPGPFARKLRFEVVISTIEFRGHPDAPVQVCIQERATATATATATAAAVAVFFIVAVVFAILFNWSGDEIKVVIKSCVRRDSFENYEHPANSLTCFMFRFRLNRGIFGLCPSSSMSRMRRFVDGLLPPPVT